MVSTQVLDLLRAGHLRELHTYVLRIDGAPPPGLEAAANAAASAAYGMGDAQPLFSFGDDVAAPQTAPPPPPASRPPRGGAAPSTPAYHAHLRLLHVFRALSPYFDGQHALVEMMWRQNLRRDEILAALDAFSDLVVTVQR